MDNTSQDTEVSASTLDIIKLLRKLGKEVNEENINALIKLWYIDDRTEY